MWGVEKKGYFVMQQRLNYHNKIMIVTHIRCLMLVSWSKQSKNLEKIHKRSRGGTSGKESNC